MPPIPDILPIQAGPLLLRPVEFQDADAIAHMYEDPAVLSALGKPEPLSPAMVQSSITAIRTQWESPFADLPLMFSILLDGAVIGFTQIKLGYDPDRRLIGELTVVLGQDARRQKHGKTTLACFIDWVFASYDMLQEVWGACVPENSASVALMKSLKMIDCGEVPANDGRLVRKFVLRRHIARAAVHQLEAGIQSQP